MKDFQDPCPMLDAGVVPRLVELAYVEALLLLDECQAGFDQAAREVLASSGTDAGQILERRRERVFGQLDFVLQWARARRGAKLGMGLIPVADWGGEWSDSDFETLSDSIRNMCHAVEALHARVMRIEAGVSRAFAA